MSHRRFKYSRPAVQDRAPLLDRILWTRDQHPIAERLLIAFAALCIGTEIVYQFTLAVARQAHAIVP